jgi:hypothetical protein
MAESRSSSGTAVLVIGVILFVVLISSGVWFVVDHYFWPHGNAFQAAITPLTKSADADQALVANAILNNYHETRQYASQWSGVYWGFTFAAGVFSALAALILKFESFMKDEAMKKDLASILSVTAALLVTLSTSGDFQNKWRSNRNAAADLEQLGYQFLASNGKESQSYLSAVGEIIHRRHVSILGVTDREQKTMPKAANSAGQPGKN